MQTRLVLAYYDFQQLVVDDTIFGIFPCQICQLGVTSLHNLPQLAAEKDDPTAERQFKQLDIVILLLFLLVSDFGQDGHYSFAQIRRLEILFLGRKRNVRPTSAPPTSKHLGAFCSNKTNK